MIIQQHAKLLLLSQLSTNNFMRKETGSSTSVEKDEEDAVVLLHQLSDESSDHMTIQDDISSK